MPKSACVRFKDWLRQRSPWLADIWRLRRTLQAGTEYRHFPEGYFPKIGKPQKPLISYREMVKRRFADREVGASRLEATLALHLRCAGYLRKQVEEEMQRHTPALLQSDSLAPKLAYLQRILDYAFGAQGDKIILDNHIGMPEVEKNNRESKTIEDYSRINQILNQELKNNQRRRMK